MTKIKNYNYSEKEISSKTVDSNNGQFIWVGFNQDASGNCSLQKVSANNPLQKYYDIDIAITEIKKGFIYSSYIYLGFDDTSLIGRRYSLNNPLTSYTDFTLPSGITEAPIDVVAYGSYVYFLIPGETSGTNTKICVFTLAGVFQETIDLSTVTNARSFTIDTTTEELWVVTYNSYADYVRVYQLSGGIYTYTVNN